ncbi:MAG TPA: antibiotic biosynthesis monooxygenase [Gemmatimonadaceae bacterium]|jgi:heme-degrading monooxygenase HmoA|nr:antibiotic biosynthesis monooxygenase [Gemmatimonadaceae bacterium]
MRRDREARSGFAHRESTGPAIIARTWRGSTRAEDADRYLDYLHSTGLDAYRQTPGNLGALVLRRIIDGRAEFLLISFWDSESAIRRFAGDDIAAAVFYPQDDSFLVDRDRHVDHFEMVFRADVGG